MGNETFYGDDLTKITKLIPSINELSVSIYRGIPRTKTNLVRGDFG